MTASQRALHLIVAGRDAPLWLAAAAPRAGSRPPACGSRQSSCPARAHRCRSLCRLSRAGRCTTGCAWTSEPAPGHPAQPRALGRNFPGTLLPAPGPPSLHAHGSAGIWIGVARLLRALGQGAGAWPERAAGRFSRSLPAAARRGRLMLPRRGEHALRALRLWLSSAPAIPYVRVLREAAIRHGVTVHAAEQLTVRARRRCDRRARSWRGPSPSRRPVRRCERGAGRGASELARAFPGRSRPHRRRAALREHPGLCRGSRRPHRLDRAPSRPAGDFVDCMPGRARMRPTKTRFGRPAPLPACRWRACGSMPSRPAARQGPGRAMRHAWRGRSRSVHGLDLLGLRSGWSSCLRVSRRPRISRRSATKYNRAACEALDRLRDFQSAHFALAR